MYKVIIVSLKIEFDCVNLSYMNACQFDETFAFFGIKDDKFEILSPRTTRKQLEQSTQSNRIRKLTLYFVHTKYFE